MSINHHDEHDYPPPAVRKHGRGTPPMPYASPRAGAGGGEIDSTLSHTFLLWVLRQWWPVVVPAGLVLAAVAGALVYLFYVPKYEASALLLISSDPHKIVFETRGDARQSEKYIQTQLELIRGPVVLDPVLARAEVAAIDELAGQQDREKYLRDHLSIKQVGRSELYDVRFSSASAKAAATVVNAVVTVYLDIHGKREFQQIEQVIDILGKERGRREDEVKRLREKVKNLATEVTGTDPFANNQQTDVNRAFAPVNALFQSLTEVEVTLEIRRAELKSLESRVNDQGPAKKSGLIDLLVDDHVEVRGRKDAIKEIENLMEQVKFKARHQRNPQLEKDANYASLQSELERMRKELVSARMKVRDIVLGERKEKEEEEQREQLAQLKLEIESLTARHAKLKERFDIQVNKLKAGGGKSVELEFAKAELEREESVFELIADRKLALQTELRAPPNVQLQKAADVPLFPQMPIPYKLLLMACSAAFVAPLGLAVVREITVRRISDSEQLARESGVRVLGEIAALPVRYVAVSPNQLSGRLRRETYVFAESINSLRTNLALANGHGPHVYAVTSAAPSEGKTSVAVSLAMSIANSCDEPTLIVDGDMRSPFVASMLKAKSQPGLFEVLAGKAKLEDVVQKVDQGRLYVIPAGRATRSTHSVVDIAEVKRLLDQLRGKFKTIILDTPPLLGASESLIFAKAADSVLFCSLANVSKARQVRLAIERLEHSQVNLEGAVLSGMPTKRYEYVYGYYANRLESND